ncbi:transposase [Streptomyces noursei]|uniref:transposase n=1 Tax=Streptomyces noursei TaxID=1971 RepID=UPI0033DCE988
MTLVESGTRALIGAVFGPTAIGETEYAQRLLHLLRPDMLVLWDKGFDGNAFLAAVTGTGAKVLGRLRNNRQTPVVTRLPDGSYLSVLGSVRVRVVDAHINVTCADGTTFGASYRLVTTLTDACRHPATALIALYHQRWEHESAYYALRHTILNGHVLRSGDPVGIDQEMWSLLTLYQLLRTVMVDAAESRHGTDPDRCGFTIAFQAARELVVRAERVVVETADPVGTIGRRVLAALLPPRRPGSAPARSNLRLPATARDRLTGGPTPATPSPTSTSPSSSPRAPSARCQPLPGMTDTPLRPAAAANGSWPCSVPIPTVTGTPGTSPSTWATSPSAPCTNNSPDGPTADSSERPAGASTAPHPIR